MGAESTRSLRWPGLVTAPTLLLLAACVAPPATPAAPDVALSRAQAAVLETELAGPNPSRGLVTGLEVAAALLPAGSRLLVHEDRFAEREGLATVPATVSGPQPGEWLLLLARDGDTWRVYGTRPA